MALLHEPYSDDSELCTGLLLPLSHYTRPAQRDSESRVHNLTIPFNAEIRHETPLAPGAKNKTKHIHLRN
jgi:hypothetical protein